MTMTLEEAKERLAEGKVFYKTKMLTRPHLMSCVAYIVRECKELHP